MLHLKYLGEESKHVVSYSKINDHVIQVTGDFPVKGNGFTLTRFDAEDNWNYQDYTTVYKLVDGGCQFSNDGSVYVVPPEPEPEPEPEPYIPTLEEVKDTKKQEIRLTYQIVKATGFDVELSAGVEHFPLTDEDSTFLMGKQFELAAGNSELISYQDAANHCKLYTRDDMQKIITAALSFVNYHTTYRNNLCEWVDECKTSDDVNSIQYGDEIPEEYQNEVLKSYLQQMKGGDSGNEENT